MQKQKALCTAETLIATARQNLFLPICNTNYLIWILVQICVILALKINIYWLYKYSPLILISTSKYFHLCDIFQSLVLIISHLYRSKQKRKKRKVLNFLWKGNHSADSDAHSGRRRVVLSDVNWSKT